MGGRRLAEVTGEENEEHATAVSMNDTAPLNAKGCRWHCGGGLIPHCSWHCSGHFGGRRLAEGAAEENAAMEEATGEDHVTAVRMNDTIWLNATGCRWSLGRASRWSCGGGFGGRRLAEVTGEENEEHATAVSMNNTMWLKAKGCRWSCGGGLIPHCSWSCSGSFGGRRLAEGAVEENEEHATAVSTNETVPLNAKGCRWSCGGGFIPHCSWSCSGGFGGRRLAERAAEENAAMEEATGEEHVEAVRMNNTIWLNAKGCSWSCHGAGLIPHCSWKCSGHIGGGRRLAEGAAEENAAMEEASGEEDVTAVRSGFLAPRAGGRSLTEGKGADRMREPAEGGLSTTARGLIGLLR